MPLAFLVLNFVALIAVATTAADARRTLRVDYYHTGTASVEILSLDRVVVEPLSWPGNPHRPLDDTNLGKYFLEVRDAESGKLLS